LTQVRIIGRLMDAALEIIGEEMADEHEVDGEQGRDKLKSVHGCLSCK
jgi:hypothetical protein